jgi:hypothetical protein
MAVDELLDAEAAVAACHRAQARAAVLQSQLATAQAACQALRQRVDDERDDVRKLKRSSMSSLLARVRGRRESLVTAEQAQLAAVEAELATHESAMRRLAIQFDTARSEAQQLDAAQHRLDDAIEQREHEIAAMGAEMADRLRDLDDELALQRAVRDELRSARHAALAAAGALDHAVGKLSVAEGWSAVDVLSEGSGGVRHGSTRFGGDWAGRAKHDQLDRAVVPIAEAHAALLRLRAELTDVTSGAQSERLHRPNVRMPSHGLGKLDVWFDNRFSDLMVHDRISSSISELERAKRSVDELLGELDPREQQPMSDRGYLIRPNN